MTLAQGQVLNNRYRIVRMLGEGGFGAVYRAWDLNLKGPCAVKESFDLSEKAQSQFAREASILFNLRHTNLPKVFDAFIIEGQGHYLVMEYIEGEDLGEVLEKTAHPLPEEKVLPWMIHVCEALNYLHTQNPPIIHRDVKPANIRITPTGQVYLVDFGIAKVFDPAQKTATAARAVTPFYSPPEQYGLGTTDAQSDIYALGATMYHLLTGQAPPPSVDIVAGCVPTPAPANQLNPAVSTQVSATIERAMQISRSARFSSIAELKSSLTGTSGPVSPTGPVQVALRRESAPPPPAIPPPITPQATVAAPSPSRRRQQIIFIALLAIGLLILSAPLWTMIVNPLQATPTPTLTATLPGYTLNPSATPEPPTDTPTHFPSPMPTSTLTPSLTMSPSSTSVPSPTVTVTLTEVRHPTKEKEPKPPSGGGGQNPPYP